ncbi:hypothetical protein BgiBS90_012612 [Biomphalaria glabrata]|nr:hypothetical protein BgiBS90_012612 [Biomphalaria glabrata]
MKDAKCLVFFFSTAALNFSMSRKLNYQIDEPAVEDAQVRSERRDGQWLSMGTRETVHLSRPHTLRWRWRENLKRENSTTRYG